LAQATFWLSVAASIKGDALTLRCLPLPTHELRIAVADASDGDCTCRVREWSAHTVAGGTRGACNKFLAKATAKARSHG